MSGVLCIFFAIVVVRFLSHIHTSIFSVFQQATGFALGREIKFLFSAGMLS